VFVVSVTNIGTVLYKAQPVWAPKPGP